MKPRSFFSVWARRALSLLVLLVVGVFVTGSQESQPVTYDDINEVAARMFCPECENVPLDKCYTSVCIQWKQDIADQLAAGATSDEIVAGFVARFGDQVVGVPQDTFLRNLALIVPTLFLILAVIVGGYTIWSRRKSHNVENSVGATHGSPSTKPAPASDAKYLAQLERDVDRD